MSDSSKKAILDRPTLRTDVASAWGYDCSSLESLKACLHGLMEWVNRTAAGPFAATPDLWQPFADPYWDVALNEALPRPVIDLGVPLKAAHPAADDPGRGASRTLRGRWRDCGGGNR